MTSNKVNKIATDILNAMSKIENRKNFRDFCDTCKRESCRDCDGKNKYKAIEEISHLS